MLKSLMVLADATSGSTLDFTGIKSSMTNAFNGASTGVIDIIGAIAPYAISVFICKYCWNQGKKFFNSMGK